MTLAKEPDDNHRNAAAHIFQDGDVLVMTLPAVVDLSLYSDLYRHLEAADHRSIQQILLDFSAVEKLCASGIAAFISLGRLSQDLRIRLLILDPPLGVSRQLDPVLPAATWIDSCQDAGIGVVPGERMVA